MLIISCTIIYNIMLVIYISCTLERNNDIMRKK